MKKLIFLFITLLGFTSNVISQCSVTTTASVNQVVCGQCADLNAIGIQGTLVMNNDFNTGVAGPGWSSTTAATYTNPCGPGPGGTYMWMGSASPAPRILTTNAFDMSCGGQVCFDFRMAQQGGASPCEGPDLPTEGIYFQYSINGGVTWITINYFNPGTGFDPIMTTWNNYCFTLPPGAWSPSTMFQWSQTATSSNLNDHWGIDNVTILANDCGYYYDWSHLPGSPNPASGGTVCPTSTTTYNVLYTNGINDTCYSSVTVNVLFPIVNVTATPPTITTCGGCTQLDAGLSSIPPDSCCYTLDMQDSFGDGWNGGSLTVNVTAGPTLGPFSAAGSGSIITFCVQDGQTFTLNYTSGSWEGENTYTLYNPLAIPIFNGGPNPATGNVFTTTANCGTAPPVYVWNWVGPFLTPINDSTQTACPTTSSWYYVTVTGGGCSTTDSVYVDYTPLPSTSTQNISACNGSTVTFPDGSTQVIGGAVTQVSTLVGGAFNGCDSVITTNVTLLPNPTSTQNISVCSGTTVVFPDGSSQVVVAATSQISTLVGAASNGCDSIITTNVSIVPSVTSTQNISVCNGTTVTFPDGSTQVISGPVSQVSTLVGASVAGCDSIVTTNVSLLPNPTSVVNTVVCSGDSYTFPDGSVNPNVIVPTSQVSTLTGAASNGCDSIVTTNISVNPVYNITQNVTICEGDNYTFPDGSIQSGIVAPVTQVSNLLTTNGCDSIVTTNVSLNPIYNVIQNVSVCSGDNYTFPDGSIQSGIIVPVTQVSNLLTTNGCDSIITTNVSIDPVYNIVENVSVCSGSSYTYPDGFVQAGIVAPTVHVSNLLTNVGCDSIITTNVSVFASYTSTTNITICSGDNYTFADGSSQTNITAPTSYVSTLTSVDGCDSLVTENISINPVYNLTESYNQCPGLNFTFPDGTTQTNINSNVVYISNLLTSNGCDSIITTTVNIYNVPPMDITFTPNGCSPLDITMTNNAAGTGCNWIVSGPGTLLNYTGCGSISDIYFNSGYYSVTLSMTSLDGCTMDTTITNAFQVYPEPIAQFTWDPNEGTITNNTINFINNSIGGNQFQWSFGDGDISNNFHDSHSYQDTGHYQIELIVINDFGCSDTAYGMVVINQEFFLFVPNAFTPDGDAFNNVFLPIVSGHDPQKYHLTIFDRWGEILFESYNSEVGWDGTYKGSIVKNDVYVWTVDVTTFNNVRKQVRGHVTVLK